MGNIADSSLTSIRDAIESSYGVSPTGTYKERRMVNETLGQDKEVIGSDELSPDRTPIDTIQVGSSASGDHVAELTGGSGANDTWDDYWLSAIGATAFSTIQGNGPGALFASGILTFANSGSNDITITNSVGNWPAQFIAGEWVYVGALSGALTVLNSTFMVKSGGGTNTLTLTAGPRVPASPPSALANSIGVFQLGSATNSNLSRSWSLERAYSLASNYGLLSGMVLGGFDIEMRPKRPLRVTWHWLGRDELHKSAQQGSGVTPAVTSRKSFSMVSDMRGISLDDDGHSFFVNSFTLSLKNGAYAQDEQGGTLGSVGVGIGTFDITGSYEFYYQDGTIHQQLSNFTDKNLAIQVGNRVGDALVFHLPRINWTGGRRPVPGKDQAVKGTVQFRAAKGPAFMLKIARL